MKAKYAQKLSSEIFVWINKNQHLFTEGKAKEYWTEFKSICLSFSSGGLSDEEANVAARRLITLALLLVPITKDPKVAAVVAILEGLNASTLIAPVLAKALLTASRATPVVGEKIDESYAWVKDLLNKIKSEKSNAGTLALKEAK